MLGSTLIPTYDGTETGKIIFKNILAIVKLFNPHLFAIGSPLPRE